MTKARVAHVLAVWFGCGHVPRAPGLAGTLGAIPLYLVLRPFGLCAVAAAAVVVTVVGVWASGVVERKAGRKDPQIVCIDEVAGVFVTWLAAPADLGRAAGGRRAVSHLRSVQALAGAAGRAPPQGRPGRHGRRRRRRRSGAARSCWWRGASGCSDKPFAGRRRQGPMREQVRLY